MITEAMRIHAVILAAGRGARMGGPKALLTLGGEAFLSRAARLLLRPGIDAVTAVVGHDAERVTREAALPPEVGILLNARYDDGMLGSILAGLDAADHGGADAVLVHPVDHPLTEPETVDAVVAALRRGSIVAVPSHGGRRGHPGGFARPAWAALRAALPREGARGVLARHPEWIEHVPGGPGCVRGVNTPADYDALPGR